MADLRALVIEDERDSARLVSFQLQRAGFEVRIAETGREGLACAIAWRPKVVMLDVRLPDIDGFEVCAGLRKDRRESETIGVLMLTAHGLPEERIRALELGADDYLTKPFNVRELTLRATALARRLGGPGTAVAAAPVLRCGAIELDPRAMEVRVAGATLALRPTELRLLQVFLEKPGAVYSRKDLLRRVWGGAVPDESRVVDVTIHRLRSALGDEAAALETIHDGGYRLRKPVRRG